MNAEENDTDAHVASDFSFEEFRLDARRTRLFRGDAEIALTPKAFAVLNCLVRNAGRLVEKSALLEAAWPHVVVEESNLSQTIYLLRRALGEHPSEHRFIVTVPGRGYRFVAEVRAVAAVPAPVPPAVGVQAASSDAGAAVPPLAGTVAQPTGHVESAVDGAAPALHVAKPRVAAAWRWAAALAGVVVVALISTSVPGDRSGSATATVKRTERPPVAADTLARGRFLFARREPGDLERARAAYEDGLVAAPRDAELWAGLASTVFLQARGGQIDFAAGMERARVAAERAIALDPTLAEPYVRLAMYYCEQQDKPRTNEYLERARRVDPGHPLLLGVLAGRAAHERRFDDAAALSRLALVRDPLNFAERGNLAGYLLAGGRLADAEVELRRRAEMHHSDDVALLIGQLRLARGDVRDAERWFAKVREEPLRSRSSALLRAARDGMRPDPEIPALAAQLKTTDPVAIAEIYAVRGEVDRAFEWLQHAARFDDSEQLALVTRPRWSVPSSPLLASLRGDPRWETWERQMEVAPN